MISLLYIDDEPGLLEIGKLFLENNTDFSVTTAESGREGLDILAQQTFDAVVSDFQMPEMNGIELLKRVRSSYGTVPFILFTGRGREEIVIDAINNGVDFYIQKGGDPKAQFAELAHKVRQAVNRRQAEAALSDSEKRLADIINFLPDATFAIDTKGIVIAWNRAMEKMTGFGAEKVLGKGDYEYALPFYHERRPLLINLVLENDEAIAQRYPFVKKEGRTLFSEITIPHFNNGRGAALWFTASPLYDSNGGVAGAIESIREITERKRAEEELVSANREYTNLLDQIQDVYYRSDNEGRLVRASRSWATLLGYDDVSECIGKNIAEEFYFNPADRQQLLEEVARSGKVTGYEVRLKKKDGTPVLIDVSSHPYFDTAGNVIGIEGTFRDMTERKKAEEARTESERRFRELADLLPQGIYEADIDGRLTYVNRFALELFGYSAEDIGSGINAISIIAPEDRERAYDAFRRVTGGGPSPAGIAEYIAQKKDGTTLPVAIYSSVISRNGRITGVRGIVIDITERKRSEDELRAAHEQLVASDEELHAQYDELAMGERRVRMSESRLRYMLGFNEYTKKSEKELLEYAIEGVGVVTGSALGYLAFLNDDESELSMYAWSKSAMAECSMVTKPIVYRTEKTGLWGEAVRQRRPVITNDYEAPNPAKKGYPEGHPRIIRHMNVPVIDEGHIVLVAGVANKPADYIENDVNELQLLVQGLWNILKQRRSEERREASEAKYRSIVDHAPAGMHFYEQRPDGSLVFTGANPGADRILGIDHRRFIGMTLEEAFPQLAGTEIPAQYRRIARDGGVWQTDQVIYGGGEIHGAYAVTAFRIAPGMMAATFVDITDRKRGELDLKAAYERVAAAEEELREQYDILRESAEQIRINEERLIMAQEIGHTGSWEYSLTKKEIWGSAEAFNIFGIHRDAGFIPVEDIEACIPGWERFRRALSDLIATGKEYNTEHLVNPADGSPPRIIHSVARLDTGGPGGTVRVIGVIRDITAQKQAEEALAQERVFTDAVFDSVPGLLYLYNDEGLLTRWNRNHEVLTGYSAEELAGMHVLDWFRHDETQAAIIRDSVARVFREGQASAEATIIKKNGEIVPFYFSAITLDIGGRKYFVGIGIDITERKRAEAALYESEARFRQLVTLAPLPLCLVNNTGEVQYTNNRFTQVFGYMKEDIPTLAEWWIRAYPDENYREWIIGTWNAAIRKAADTGTDIEPLEYNVTCRDGTVRNVIIGGITFEHYFLATFNDITDSRLAQDTLRESEEKYRMLAESAFDGIAIHQGGILVYVNKTAARLLGSDDPGVFLGKSAIDIVSPELREKIIGRIQTSPETALEVMHEQLLRIDGSKLDAEVTAVPGTWKGRPAGIVTFRDISDRKRAEEALRESEEKFRTLVEINRDIIFSLSTDGTIHYVSPRTITQLGYEPGEMEGRNLTDFVHPEDAGLLAEHISDKFVQGKIAPSDRFRVRRKDGTYRWFEDTTIYTRDSRMRPIAVGTIRDITEEKAAQDALRESEARLSSILNTVQAGIVIVDAASHTIMDANEKALQLIGLDRDSVIGEVCHRFICPSEKGRCPVTDLGQKVDTSERVLVTASGKSLPMLKTVIPVSISGRDVLVESFVDISEQKRTEAAMREINRKLSLLNTITRHDIRNQLTIVLGYTQLAEMSRPGDAVMDFLAKITAAIETIQRQIEFTKTYQELGVHAPGWFRVRSVVGSVRPGTIDLRTDCNAVEIFADPMIDKVFFNLFDNALKYGERVTTVTLTCIKRQNTLVITFSDNGCGIATAEKSKIFEKGYGRNTGLGLFLVREILAITGMTIRETGTPGEGAVFEITVPDGAYRNTE